MAKKELKNILIIEDETDIQFILKMALEKLDTFNVSYCSSGKEALKSAEEFQPDLILLDEMMPGMDGIATFKALRQVPSSKDIPIVFMTAKVQASEKKQYYELGASDVISKPFDIKNLASRLRQLWDEALNPKDQT
ncbi:response regulator [Legionella sp. km772]|uniref:response regulator n=1 Tax=Legionella sp. km772 TaxID=2498111 RepID=UPI000F8D8ADB|nr:response regulator [Legionella sp. km772]RUR04454.1 response regulator [Legionella sp. km772]